MRGGLTKRACHEGKTRIQHAFDDGVLTAPYHDNHARRRKLVEEQHATQFITVQYCTSVLLIDTRYSFHGTVCSSGNMVSNLGAWKVAPSFQEGVVQAQVICCMILDIFIQDCDTVHP